jgi:protocatechuate 3,4-dioxygenase beta subunit
MPGPNIKPVTTRTDAAGAFRLEMKGAGPYTVRVEAAGLAAAMFEKVTPGPRLAVALAKGGAIDGTVRDGNSGAPVPRVVVEAREERRGVYLPNDVDAGVVRARTDEQGRFRLEGLAIGLHHLNARARGFDSARRSSVRTGSRVDLYLFPGSAIVGTVRDAQGQPVAKAVVGTTPEMWPFRFGRMETSSVATDAEGRFELAGLQEGRYRLTVRAPDFAPGTVAEVNVEAGADAEADVVLYRGSTVSGRLVGPNEKPVAGRVSVHEDDRGSAPIAYGDWPTADADAEGRFRVERVPPGSHAVAVTAPGYASQRLSADVGTAGTPVDLGDIVLETGLTIRGRVRDHNGSAIAEAQVNAFARRPGFGNMNSARSEPDGSFVLGGLTPGTYRVTARASGYGVATRSVEAGGDGGDFVLDAAGGVTGLVVDEAGKPVDAFRVMARPKQEESGFRVPPTYEMVADAEGRFTLEDMAAATYVLQVSAPDRADGVVSNVKIAPGALVDVGRIRLAGGGTVRGTVVDAGGTPVPGANITVRGQSQAFGAGAGGETVSDGAGAFEIRGVASGTIDVLGKHPSYADAHVSVDVDPARGPAEARLVMSPGGRVEGSVRRRDGSGVAGVMVQVTSLQGGGVSFPGQEVKTTSSDGTFAVDHMPAGRVDVTLLVGTAGQYQAGSTKQVNVVEGETAVADFVTGEILVSGVVTRGGAPAPNLRVTVRGERQYGIFMSFNASPVPAAPSGPQRGTAVTREDGSYELLVDEPGKHHASAASLDGRLSYPTRPVDIPDTDSFALNLAFSGTPVTGIVLDRETEQPIIDANLYASPKEPNRGFGGGGAASGPDGRFTMELDPGDYTMNVGAEGYARDTSDLTVSAGSGAELRFTLARGGAISGRLVDAAGNPVGGVHVMAMSGDGDRLRTAGGQPTLPDGTFQIPSLSAGTYTLSASTNSGAFAIRAGLAPGQKDVTLRLQPGGRVQLLVRGPDGAPVEGAYSRVSQLQGIATMMGMGAPTSVQGTTEMKVPAGVLELRANKDKLEGRTLLEVPVGGTVPAEIVLEEKAPPGSKP